MDSSWSDKHHRKGFVALQREFRSSASLRYLPSIVVSDQKYALGVKIFAVGRCRAIDQEKWSWQAVQWFPTICEAAANFGRGEEARIVDKVFYVWIASLLLTSILCRGRKSHLQKERWRGRQADLFWTKAKLSQVKPQDRIRRCAASYSTVYQLL